MYITNCDIQTMISIGEATPNTFERWYKMNWYAVKRSHDIIHTRGKRGHVLRQVYRHTAWKVIQNRCPYYRMYKIPYSIRGNSKCRLTLKHHVINWIKQNIYGGCK
jgi:hypothetical protein